MQPSVYAEMRAVEDDHWWFAGLRRLVLEAGVRAVKGRGRARVLDAGCGTGGAMAALRRVLPTTTIAGIDASAAAVRLAATRRAGALARASIESLPFPDGVFDLVLCLDVIYIAGVDDRRGLAELRRVLRTGGTLLLNLPAFEWLRGGHDLAVATARRYTRRAVGDLLRDAGFVVGRLSYWNTTLVPAMVLWRGLTRMRSRGCASRSDLWLPSPWPNRALTWLLAAEIRLGRRVPLPFGSSVFAVATATR